MENIMKAGKYDRDFDGIRWAIAIRSRDDLRPYIKCIKVDDGLIVATDGSRLHCYLTDREIENGTYEVVQENASMIVLQKSKEEFPDYERVFPVITHNGIPSISTPEKDKDERMDLVLNTVLRNSEHSYNVRFLLDACIGGETFHFSEADGNGPLVIRNNDDTKAALIMPRRD